MAETHDKFLNGRVTLWQPARGYRAAIDPVVLAAAVPARKGQKILELGCGAGVALFCLAARVPGLHITGIELQDVLLGYAQRNAAAYAVLGSFMLLQGDVARLPRAVPANIFDHVFANPPYHDSLAYDAGDSSVKTLAHAMPGTALGAWVRAAHGRLKHRGTLTMIYPAEGLSLLLAALDKKFGAVTVLPLWPKEGQAAKRIIVQGKKDSKSPFKLLPGLTLHAPDGSYTNEANAILRDASALGIAK